MTSAVGRRKTDRRMRSLFWFREFNPFLLLSCFLFFFLVNQLLKHYVSLLPRMLSLQFANISSGINYSIQILIKCSSLRYWRRNGCNEFRQRKSVLKSCFFLIMAFVRRIPVYGTKPPCAYSSRIEERRQQLKTKRLERNRKLEKQEDFVVYHSSEDEDEEEYNDITCHRILFSSNNFADYIRAREYASKEYHTFDVNYGTRHVLSHDMLKESPIALESEVNKIFCSSWLSNRQVVFGTKCNKVSSPQSTTGVRVLFDTHVCIFPADGVRRYYKDHRSDTVSSRK